MIKLVRPEIIPPLDEEFCPASLVNRRYREMVEESGASKPVGIAIEKPDGSTSVIETKILPQGHIYSDINYLYIERMVKFLLWSRGGYRIYISGAPEIAARLQGHYRSTATGRFDSDLIGERVYGHPIEVMSVSEMELPKEKRREIRLGRNWNGCRVGFDLGASDRKCAAVIDGEVLFTNETPWNPSVEKDPQYHFEGIMDSIRQAAKYLPRVDAIGGSSAGVYVNNQVRVASLFRAVPAEQFKSRVVNLFYEIKEAWRGVPLEVANDGEVTALAGSMALNDNAVLGIAMGSSQAAGYVTPEGNITDWLNELAFAPVDYNPQAPIDEWSGDYGCGVQYFSQQAVGRLARKAGIEIEQGMKLPEILKYTQGLVEKGDARAIKIFETIGVYLGYAIAHYGDFYTLKHILVLGRVTSGTAGSIIVEKAKEVLKTEFMSLFESVQLHIPDEKEKRHGQAVAAASLPVLEK